jgi:hypothetical protein
MRPHISLDSFAVCDNLVKAVSQYEPVRPADIAKGLKGIACEVRVSFRFAFYLLRQSMCISMAVAASLLFAFEASMAELYTETSMILTANFAHSFTFYM